MEGVARWLREKKPKNVKAVARDANGKMPLHYALGESDLFVDGVRTARVARLLLERADVAAEFAAELATSPLVAGRALSSACQNVLALRLVLLRLPRDVARRAIDARPSRVQDSAASYAARLHKHTALPELRRFKRSPSRYRADHAAFVQLAVALASLALPFAVVDALAVWLTTLNDRLVAEYTSRADRQQIFELW